MGLMQRIRMNPISVTYIACPSRSIAEARAAQDSADKVVWYESENSSPITLKHCTGIALVLHKVLVYRDCVSPEWATRFFTGVSGEANPDMVAYPKGDWTTYTTWDL